MDILRDAEIHYKEITIGDEVVRSAYVARKSDKNSCKTAREWAECGTWSGGVQTKDKTSGMIEYKGEEFSSRILDCVGRDQSGYTYRVGCLIGDHTYVIEMKSPTLIRILKETGIVSGGRIEGSMVICKDRGQTRPMLVGGTDYLASIEAEKEAERKRKAKVISIKDLVVNGVYKDDRDSEWTYIGKHDVFTLTTSYRISYYYGAGSRTDTYSKVGAKHVFIKNTTWGSRIATISKPRLLSFLGIDKEPAPIEIIYRSTNWKKHYVIIEDGDMSKVIRYRKEEIEKYGSILERVLVDGEVVDIREV